MKRTGFLMALGLITAGMLAMPAIYAPALAQSSQTEQQIIDSLKPKKRTTTTRSLTRSFSAKPAEQGFDAEDEAFLQRIQTRGIKIQRHDREKLDEIVKKEELPSIDIEIQFDYDSAAIRPSSLKDVDTLGRALSSDALKGSRFVLNGHTDATGSDAYNQGLSERRAASVRQFLAKNYGIAEDRLLAIGYGEERLKNTADPAAAENRRVEVINLTKG